MVKIRGMVFVLGVLMLSGCSDAGVEPVVESAPAVESAVEEVAVEALIPEVVVDPVESEFDTAIRRIPGLENVDQKAALEVGHDVCAQLSAGADPLTLTAVEDTDRSNNWDAILVSTLTLCTDQTDAVEDAFNAVYSAENSR